MDLLCVTRQELWAVPCCFVQSYDPLAQLANAKPQVLPGALYLLLLIRNVVLIHYQQPRPVKGGVTCYQSSPPPFDSHAATL